MRNRSSNSRALSDRGFNRNANKINRSDRWDRRDRWGRWHKRPYYKRYPYNNYYYPYYNYNPYYYPILDTNFVSPLNNYSPIKWFYRYPYYYYFYGYPYNRWYKVYQPTQGIPLYSPPLATNLVAIDSADQNIVTNDATIYAVPEGFDTTPQSEQENAIMPQTEIVSMQQENAQLPLREIGDIQDYTFNDYIAYDALMKSNNSTYFMCGIFLLMIILLLIVLFS